MFRRLHAQFVFINLIVIACVFSVLALGSYWFLRTHFTEKAAFFAERMVEDAERGRLPASSRLRLRGRWKYIWGW